MSSRGSVVSGFVELHLNHDGVKTGEGMATLPVKDFFKRIVSEAKPKLPPTVATAGGVFDEFELGDTVITRAAKFRLEMEFRKEPFNGKTYKSDWQIPTSQFAPRARAELVGGERETSGGSAARGSL